MQASKITTDQAPKLLSLAHLPVVAAGWDIVRDDREWWVWVFGDKHWLGHGTTTSSGLYIF